MLHLKCISGVHNERASYLGLKETCSFVCYELLVERMYIPG